MTIDFQIKKEIIEMRRGGATYSNIAKVLGVAESTVWKVLKENKTFPLQKTPAEHSLIKVSETKVSEAEGTEDFPADDTSGTENEFAEHLYALAEELEKSDQANLQLTKKLEEAEKRFKNLKERYNALEDGSKKAKANQEQVIAKRDDTIERLKKAHMDLTEECCKVKEEYSKAEVQYKENIETYEARIGELEHKKTEIPQDFIAEFDALHKENGELKAKVVSLNESLNGMIAKQAQKGTVITYGFEKDFFPAEIREYILEILDEYIRNHDDGDRSRKIDCVKDILENNGYQKIHSERREQLKIAVKRVNNDIYKLVPIIKSLGFSKVSSNNHEKVIYFDDPRYTSSLSNTSSDVRVSKNVTSQFIKEFM